MHHAYHVLMRKKIQIYTRDADKEPEEFLAIIYDSVSFSLKTFIAASQPSSINRMEI